MRGSQLRGLGERLLCRFRLVADATTHVDEATAWEAEAERIALVELSQHALHTRLYGASSWSVVGADLAQVIP